MNGSCLGRGTRGRIDLGGRCRSAEGTNEGETMGFTFRRTIRLGRRTHVNLSKSGVSLTQKAGRVTVNSRGNVSARLLKGVGYKKKLW